MTERLVADAEPSVEDVPRGPHLPDVLTRVPLVVWPFVALAAWVAWVQWQRALVVELAGPGDGLLYIAGALPPVLAPLVGAALFLRHRDASRSLPMLTFGVTLLAAHQVLQLAQPVVAPLLERLIPGNDTEPPFVGPLVFGLQVLIGLVQGFALLYLARGLGTARRYLDAPRTGLVTIAALLAALALPAINLWNVLVDADRYASQVPNVVASLAVGLLTMLAWGYLASTATNGVRAGEQPRAGWLAAAAAGALLLAATAVIAVVSGMVVALGTVEPGSPLYEVYLTVFRLYSVVAAAAWVLLVAAFLAGLPELDEEADTDDADDEWADSDTTDPEPVPVEPVDPARQPA